MLLGDPAEGEEGLFTLVIGATCVFGRSTCGGLVRHFPYTSTLFIGVSRSSKVSIVSPITSSFAQLCRVIVFLGQCLSTHLASCILVVLITTKLVSISNYLLLFYIITCLVGCSVRDNSKSYYVGLDNLLCDEIGLVLKLP